MSAFFGADVDALRALGAQFISQADDLDGLASRLTSRVGTAPWRGPDAERFRSDWNQRHSSAIRNAAIALRNAADSARTNASQQDSASSAGTASPASISLSGGSGVGGSVPMGFGSMAGPAIQYLSTHSPGQILSDADGLLATKIGPFELGSLGKEIIPGAGNVTDTLDIASKISNGQVPWSEMLGVAAGGVQDAARDNPAMVVPYLGATAVKVWLDAADQASKADFSSATMQSTGNYILSNPADAAAAAGEAIVGWVPNLLDDFGL